MVSQQELPRVPASASFSSRNVRSHTQLTQSAHTAPVRSTGVQALLGTMGRGVMAHNPRRSGSCGGTSPSSQQSSLTAKAQVSRPCCASLSLTDARQVPSFRRVSATDQSRELGSKLPGHASPCTPGTQGQFDFRTRPLSTPSLRLSSESCKARTMVSPSLASPKSSSNKAFVDLLGGGSPLVDTISSHLVDVHAKILKAVAMREEEWCRVVRRLEDAPKVENGLCKTPSMTPSTYSDDTSNTEVLSNTHVQQSLHDAQSAIAHSASTLLDSFRAERSEVPSCPPLEPHTQPRHPETLTQQPTQRETQAPAQAQAQAQAQARVEELERRLKEVLASTEAACASRVEEVQKALDTERQQSERLRQTLTEAEDESRFALEAAEEATAMGADIRRVYHMWDAERSALEALHKNLRDVDAERFEATNLADRLAAVALRCVADTEGTGLPSVAKAVEEALCDLSCEENLARCCSENGAAMTDTKLAAGLSALHQRVEALQRRAAEGC
uniref:Uncharacterized protein n=1 Tax=Noctiluca scintillans TaxID=2966 RepID=A0A7S1A418_NOCSC